MDINLAITKYMDCLVYGFKQLATNVVRSEFDARSIPDAVKQGYVIQYPWKQWKHMMDVIDRFRDGGYLIVISIGTLNECTIKSKTGAVLVHVSKSAFFSSNSQIEQVVYEAICEMFTKHIV